MQNHADGCKVGKDITGEPFCINSYRNTVKPVQCLVFFDRHCGLRQGRLHGSIE